jgi:uncharacterized repeat protein (TIGR03803 family)
VFKISTGGVLTLVADGPSGALVQATNGDLYGATTSTIFKLTPSGITTTLASVRYANALLQGTDGNFYATNLTYPNGAVFKMTPAGVLTTLASFDSSPATEPVGRLVQATDGNFYGVTGGNVFEGGGTLFRITPDGVLTNLYGWPPYSDNFPQAGLVQAADGNLYGSTSGYGNCLEYGVCGSIFKITLDGVFTTVYRFHGYDGANPVTALIQATDGNLYGTTPTLQTAPNGGTLFRLTPEGVLTTLYTFPWNPEVGHEPSALFQATDGNLYGTTYGGGTSNYGEVYKYSLGLSPFVITVPVGGKAGRAVRILGTNLTGATSVTFNGVPATFEVVSPTQITTSVPIGATTGPVQVVGPNGTLASNVVFQVEP